VGKFSLVKLLYIGVVVNILAILVISGFSVWSQRQLQQNTEELHEHPLAVTRAAMEFRLNIEDTDKYLDKALHHGGLGAEEIGDIHIIEAQAEENIKTLKKLYRGDSSDIDKISSDYEIIKRLSSEAIKICALGKDAEAALYLEKNGWRTAFDNISYNCATVVSFSKSKADEFLNKS